MKTIIISLKALLFFTLLTGVLYPLLITGLAQMIFPAKSNGSMISVHGNTVGSSLIGQAFDSERYFSSRPSAVSYNPLPSGASNDAITSARLKKKMDERILSFRQENSLDSTEQIPAEMVFASGSGLDPDISVRAALLQVNRVARVRGLTDGQKQKLIQLIKNQEELPQFLFLGEKRINVLLLNLEVDKIQ